MIREKNIVLLMDSHLEGKFSTEEATVVVNLASKCLQNEPRERPSTKELVSTLAPLHTKPDVSNFSLIAISDMLFDSSELHHLCLLSASSYFNNSRNYIYQTRGKKKKNPARLIWKRLLL